MSRPEKLLFTPNAAGSLAVCLAYPNRYEVGMANLGYQTVFRILATAPGVVCERAFLEAGEADTRGRSSRRRSQARHEPRSDSAPASPRARDSESELSPERLSGSAEAQGAPRARGPGRSLESGRTLAEFDLLAFSLSFEADYPNIVRMLDAAGIPARAADRREGSRAWPLLIAGGPATFLNPEPVAPFFDLFLIGEGEEMIPEAFAGAAGWSGAGAERILGELSAVAGAYRPDLFRPEYGDAGQLCAFVPVAAASTAAAGLVAVRAAPSASALAAYGAAPGETASGSSAATAFGAGRLSTPGPANRVLRRYLGDLDAYPVTTAVMADAAVFGDYYLVEASRGCEWGCRFCAAGFMYRPVRHRSAAGIAADALRGRELAATIGLVGAEMASQPGMASICERIAASGGRASPSSLKADQISPRLAAAVAGAGNRSVTVAPEAGSERMRRVINKNLSEEEILRAADLMVGDGVESLKLYFMCGLPTETAADLGGIYDLTVKIRERLLGPSRSRGRLGRVKVSLNPFVPKPWTPFQWDAMERVSSVQAKISKLGRRLGALPNVDMDADSPREAYLQTLLSRGDRRVAAIIEALARDPRGWWQQLQAMRRGEHPAAEVSPDVFVYRRYDHDELFPWDFIDHRVDKSYLWLERRRALAERETEPCDVATCRTCGAC